MAKFKALVSFSHYDKMHDPHSKEVYEHEDEALVAAWKDAGYVEIVEEKSKKAKEDKGE
jgi:hypothetical protein